MSYSNPKIYQQDPLAFAKGFEKSFTTSYQAVEDHIAEVRKQVQQKNKNLQEAGEDIAETVNKSKNLVGQWSNELANEGLSFIRESQFFEEREEGGALKNVSSARVGGGINAIDLQNAQSSFKAMTDSVNYVAEFAVDTNKYKNADKSNKYYADVNLAMDYISSHPESLIVSRVGNDFQAEFAYPDPNGEWTGEDGNKYSRIPADVLQAKLMTQISKENFDKLFDTTVEGFKGTIKSEIDKQKEDAKFNNESLMIDGIERTRERTGPMLRRLYLSEKNKQNGSKGTSFFDSTFANLGDNIPFDFEDGVEVYGNTQKELFAKTAIGAEIIETIDTAKDKEELLPYLRAILDLPVQDKRIEGHIAQMRKAGIISKAQVPELLEALEEYKFNVVKEVVDIDIISRGVDSQSVLKRRQKPISTDSDKSSKNLVRDERQLINLFDYIGVNPTMEPISADQKAVSTPVSIEEGIGPTAGKIRTSSGKRDITGIEVDPENKSKIKIYYGKEGRSLEFDRKNPDSLFNLFQATSVNSVKPEDFNNIIRKEFSTENGMKRLDENGMQEWVQYLEDIGMGNQLQNYFNNNKEKLKNFTIGTWDKYIIRDIKSNK